MSITAISEKWRASDVSNVQLANANRGREKKGLALLTKAQIAVNFNRREAGQTEAY